MFSKQKLLDQINQANGTQLTLDDLRFGQTVEVPPTESTPQNTETTIAAAQGSAYRGKYPIAWRRNDLQVLLGSTKLVASVPVYNATVTDILVSLQKRYGLEFSADDLNIQPFDDSTTSVTVSTSPNSYSWVSGQSFTIRLSRKVENIAEQLTQTLLPGFNYPVLITQTILPGFSYPVLRT